MARRSESAIANAPEVLSSRELFGSPNKWRLFEMWFGQVGTTTVHVWAESFDDAFEEAVEYLDDQGMCGYFVDLDDGDLREAARDLGYEWDPDWPDWNDRRWQRVVERAEADLTVIGHTTLKCGRYVPSYEWGGEEVPPSSEEFELVALASLAEVRRLWPDDWEDTLARVKPKWRTLVSSVGYGRARAKKSVRRKKCSRCRKRVRARARG